jgi:hypothetical protein
MLKMREISVQVSQTAVAGVPGSGSSLTFTRRNQWYV